MPDSSHPLHFSIVRIHDANGAIVGAGFLATPYLVCTCAHVVADALSLPRETEHPPESDVHLDFPFLDGAEGAACVYAWVRMELDDGGGDIAILRLMTDPPAAARPARLLPVSTLSGKAFVAYGFPSKTDVGQYAYGILRDRLANGYVQLEGSSTQGYRIQQGYSGTPVWDQSRRGVVGMVVEEDRTPDAKVAFLIPNDLLFGTCSEIKPVSFHQLFASLTDGLMGLPGSPLGGVEQFLNTYLGTSETPAPFGGRQEQLAALDRWLATPGQPYALLVEEAGRGKSALLAQWVAAITDERRADVAFVPISLRFGTSLKSTTVSLLGARLRYLHNVRADPPRDMEEWLAEIEMYLRTDRSTSSPLLIVLDGADEAADWIVGQDLRFPPEPGNGVKVVVSARSLVNCDAEGWVRRLEWQGVGVLLKLPPLDRAGIVEVLQSMGNPLARLGTQVDVISELHRLSGGDPLLVGLYVKDLLATDERATLLTPETLKELKPGLHAYFDQWWHDQHRIWGASAPLKEKGVRVLLNLLACAQGPLSRDDLLSLTEIEQFDSWMVEEALQPLARFVVGNGKEHSYVFSHPRLNHYFFEKLSPREHQVWEQRFLDYGRQILAALTFGKCDPGEVSSYAVRYYGVHLERNDADPVYLNELICQGWQRAWEALEGTYDGFLSDLMRAWKRADAVATQTKSMQERSRVISWQCRYALILASIKSLVGNIPPTLLKALVGKGVWTPVQGVAAARQIPWEEQQADALVELASYLSASQLQEVLEMAQTFSDEKCKAKMLVGLAPYLSTLQTQEVLKDARAMSDRWSRAEVLVGLVPFLSAPQVQEVLEVAISDEWNGPKVLVGLASYLSASQLQEVLEVAQAFLYEKNKAKALAGLAPYLPASLQAGVLQKAWKVTQAIRAEQSKAEALAALVPRIGECGYRRNALEVAQTISDEWSKAKTLVELAPHLSTLELQEVLEVAQTISDEWSKMEALAGLAPYLSASQLREVLEIARAIGDEEHKAKILAELAPYLSASQLREVLKSIRIILDEKSRAKVLTDLMHSSEEYGYREQVLKTAWAIGDKESKAKALVGLAPHLPASLQTRVLQEALKEERAIFDKESKAKALVGLAPHLPASLQTRVLQKVLKEARAIGDEESKAKVLVDLAPYLSSPEIQEVLKEARAIVDKQKRAKVLAALVPQMEQFPPLILYSLWNQTLHNQATNTRPNLLSDIQALVPLIAILGGKEALIATMQAIIEVGEWFP